MRCQCGLNASEFQYIIVIWNDLVLFFLLYLMPLFMHIYIMLADIVYSKWPELLRITRPSRNKNLKTSNKKKNIQPTHHL